MNSSVKLIARTDVGPTGWNRCADAFPEAWIWHRWEAIDAYATWADTRDCSFALMDAAASEPVALVPLRRVLGRRPVRQLGAILESTGGPAYAPGLSPRQRTRVEKALREGLSTMAAREGAYRVELAMAPLAPARLSGNGVNPLVMLGCREASTQSWILRLADRDEDALWRNLEHRVRKTVNKAERGGVTVRDIAHRDFGDFLRLHRATSARNELPAKPEAYFGKIFGDFIPQGLASGFCAVAPDGRVIAIHIFAVYKKAALYWVVASDKEALHSGANDLVQWHAIRSFAANGLLHYECGEAFPGAPDGKHRRISDFKKGFGGDLAPYHRGTLVPRPRTAAFFDLLRSLRNNGNRSDA
ncbi:MAG: hypothetical protein CMM26_02840 [Rhodospirillaceae bacterium]|nr:hypothetical protein [Rhodospirillaceae bacterium]